MTHGRFGVLNWFADVLLGYDVFVSYAWRDGREYARRLVGALSEQGYRCFLDDSEIPSGSDLTETVPLSLRRSSSLVVVVTEAAVASHHVAGEIRSFASSSRPLIPIFLQPELRAGPPNPVLSILITRVWIDDPDGLERRAPSTEISGRLRQTFRFLRRSRIRTAALVFTTLVFALIASVALIQMYRVETARNLSNAQLLARTQPTEALLLLSEMKDRWFADASLLPQLSADLVDAPLTVARQLVGDAVADVAWNPTGGYAAASMDGRTLLWTANGRPAGEIAARRASTAWERQAYGKSVVPLSRVLFSQNGAHVATEDWQGCIRRFSMTQLLQLRHSDLPQQCLNEWDEAKGRYEPGVLTGGGTLARLKDGAIELRSDTDRLVQLPRRPHPIETLVADRDERIFVRYADGHVVTLRATGEIAQIASATQSLGACIDGSVWLLDSGGTLSRHSGESQAAHQLLGRPPWRLSASCGLYLDGGGDLYRLDGTLLLRTVAENWNHGGNGVNVAFSNSERLLAVSSHEGPISVVDIKTGARLSLLGHVQRVFQMKFSVDDRRLLSGSFDGSVRVFDLNSRLASRKGSYPGAEAVYSSMDGDRAIASRRAYDIVAFRELPASQPLVVDALQPDGSVRDVAVRKDWEQGGRYVLADGDTNFAGICSEPGCADTHVLRALRLDFDSSGATVHARVSPDGRLVVVVQEQALLHVFDIERANDTPILRLSDSKIRSSTFDQTSGKIYILSDQEVSVLPFAAPAVAEAVAEKVHFCLSSQERQVHFGEWNWLASSRATRCQARRSG